MMRVEFNGQKIEDLQFLPEQGFSNINYTFIFDKKKYLLRQFKLQDRDRQLEFDVQTLVCSKGLAAKPYELNLAEGYMICDFLEGHHKEKLERENIAQVVQVLKILHRLHIEQPVLDIKKEFSVFSTELKEAFEVIDNTPKETVLCHNDLNPKNLIFLDRSLKLIDWEFAGMNDRYFDLAALSVEFNFELLDDAYMLALYFGKEGWNKEKLDAYKVVYKALCQQWFHENT